MQYSDFDATISKDKLSAVGRAVAILWLSKSAYAIDGMTAKEIAKIIEDECGHPRQNATRLDEQLRLDRRTAKHGGAGWRLRPDAIRSLDEQYSHLIAQKKPKAVISNSLIPREIFEQASRTYITRVLDQVNGCYDNGFYDASAVMARRLIETLVIDIYVEAGRALEIKQPNGFFLALDDLIGKISADTIIHLSREAKRALPEIKKIADQSAHNSRFTARQSDIDAIKHGLRIASEELFNLCHFKS